jgi:hypothetical protein
MIDRPAATPRTLVRAAPYRRARGLTGWSFAGLTTRHLDPPPPWDYEALAASARLGNTRARSRHRRREVLSRVVAGGEARVIATEEWGRTCPSRGAVRAARRRRRAAGARRCCSRAKPSDLVLDRHEELDLEVARVLAPGGRVLTQQCGADEAGAARYFPRKEHFGDLFNGYAGGFRAAGLDVLRAERHRARVTFGSLGDVVYMLLVAPWTVPGFDPEADIEALIALEDGLSSPEGIILTEERFLIEAARP